MSNDMRKRGWRDTVPDQLKPVGNPEGELNLKEMFHDKSVIAGIVTAVIGIILAVVSFQFCTGNLRMILAFAAAAMAFTGTGQITKYINEKTMASAQSQNGKRK